MRENCKDVISSIAFVFGTISIRGDDIRIIINSIDNHIVIGTVSIALIVVFGSVRAVCRFKFGDSISVCERIRNLDFNKNIWLSQCWRSHILYMSLIYDNDLRNSQSIFST